MVQVPLPCRAGGQAQGSMSWGKSGAGRVEEWLGCAYGGVGGVVDAVACEVVVGAAVILVGVDVAVVQACGEPGVYFGGVAGDESWF